MENTSLSDALISLIPTYGPRIIFGIVALESAGVPLPGETILVAAALLAATTGQISIVVVVLASAGGAIVGDGIGYMVGRRFGLPLIRRYGRMAAHGAKQPFVGIDKGRCIAQRFVFNRAKCARQLRSSMPGAEARLAPQERPSSLRHLMPFRKTKILDLYFVALSSN